MGSRPRPRRPRRPLLAGDVRGSRGATIVAPRRSPRAAYAAATWALVFAARGVYWALGGTAGLGTLSSGIQQAAEDGDPWLFVGLWISVGLELTAAWLALALGGCIGRRLPSWLPLLGGRAVPEGVLLVATWGAGAVLAGHGSLFVGFGLVAVIGGREVTSEARWYALLWGPWFLMGGLLLLLTGWFALRRSPGVWTSKAASTLGVLGGLVATVAPFAVSAVAG